MHKEKGAGSKPVPIKKKKHLFVGIFFLFILILSGCKTDDKKIEEGYYASVTEEINTEYDYYLMDKKENEHIIYYGINYDENKNQYSGNIICYNLETKKSRLLDININALIQDFKVINDNIYILLQNNADNYEIQSFDYEGNFLKKITLEDYGTILNAHDIYFWDVDREENILIIDSENKLHVLESNKDEYMNVLAESVFSAYISDENQFIYLGSDNQGNNIIYQIDYRNGGNKTVLLDDQSILGNCLGIFEGEGEYVLINGDNTLYKLDINSKQVSPILEWLDVNIDNSSLCDIEENGGNFNLCNKNSGKTNAVFEFTRIYLKSGSDNRKTIEIATIFSDQELKRKIVDFNKQHSDIKIHLRMYGNSDNASERFGKMVNELNSQSDIDIIITDTTYFQALAERGNLTELDSYIRNSSMESKLVPSVVDAYKINGKSYVIMDRFEVYTVLGRKEVFKGDRTYSLSELTDILQTENAISYNENTKSDILFDFFIMNDNYEVFSKLSALDLKSILKVSNEASSDFASYEKDALMEKVVIKQNFYFWFALFRAGHGDDFSIIGYPCEENMGNGAMFDVPCLYGINTYSENKEESWMFIKELLEDERQKEIEDYFPVNKNIFEEKLKACTKSVDKGKSVVYITGDTQIEAILNGISQEDIDRVRKSVYGCNQYYYMDNDFFNIIREEAEVYYAGQKNEDEAINIINNRMGIYFNEKIY